MDPNNKRLQKSQEKALVLKRRIEQACITAGLNLTIYEGKIGFVDHGLGKIVMLWEPRYGLSCTQKGDDHHDV